MSVLKDGIIIEFRDKKKVSSVICLKVEAKNIRVANEANKEFNLPINKVTHITNKSISLSKARYEIIEELKEYVNLAEAEVKNINLSDLWELLKDEDDEITYDIKSLTDFYFSEPDNTYKRSAIFRAITEDQVYFDQKTEGVYLTKSQKNVEQILYQRKVEEERQKQKQITLLWLKDIINNKTDTEKPAGANKILEMIVDVAVFDNKSEKCEEVTTLISELNQNISNLQEFLVDLLYKAGVFDADENLLLREYNISEGFSNAVLDEIKDIEIDFATELSGRHDLRDLYTITIDDEETKDIDDALSYKEIEDGYQIGIHIADAAHFVKEETLLDKEACSRATTIYVPDKKIEMLPQLLSEELCSLVEGQDRLAISVIISFDNSNNIVNYEVFESVIHVNKRLSYNEADKICMEDPLISKLLYIAEFIKQKRISDGAIIFNFPELKIKVNEQKEISVGKYKNNSSTQMLVSEYMILANYIMAEYLYKNKIPCIYRSQEEPSEVLDINGSDIEKLISMFKQRRYMKKSEVSVFPNEHHGLGIKLYCQMTSPIRRYSDLVIHRQIKSYIKTEAPFYTEDEIREVINFTEHSLFISNVIQRSRIRYWLCKFLKNYIGYKTPATVLDVQDDKYIVQLSDLATELPLMKDWGVKLQEGQEIEVVIKDIHIRKGIIIIKFLKNPSDEIKKIEF